MTDEDLPKRRGRPPKSETEQEEKPRTLPEKLCAIMGKMQRLPKNGFNAHFKYPFATNEDVLDYVRPLLAAEGITFAISMDDVNIEGDRVLCRFRMIFSDGSTGEVAESQWFGQAKDTSDKGVAKAATSAVKYFMLKNFLLSAGDEPEIDTDDHRSTGQAKAPSGIVTPQQLGKLRALVKAKGRVWTEFEQFIKNTEKVPVAKLPEAVAAKWIDKMYGEVSSVEEIKQQLMGDENAECE